MLQEAPQTDIFTDIFSKNGGLRNKVDNIVNMA